jgi:hypothetical protein
MIKLKSQYPGVLVTIAVDGLVTLFWNENVGVDVGRIDADGLAKITAAITAAPTRDELREQARRGGVWMESGTINRLLDATEALATAQSRITELEKQCADHLETIKAGAERELLLSGWMETGRAEVEQLQNALAAAELRIRIAYEMANKP